MSEQKVIEIYICSVCGALENEPCRSQITGHKLSVKHQPLHLPRLVKKKEPNNEETE